MATTAVQSLNASNGMKKNHRATRTAVDATSRRILEVAMEKGTTAAMESRMFRTIKEESVKDELS